MAEDREPRFSNRAPSMREMVLMQRIGRDTNDFEATAELMERRRLDQAWDVLDLSGEELAAAISEMFEGITAGASLMNVFKSFKM